MVYLEAKDERVVCRDGVLRREDDVHTEHFDSLEDLDSFLNEISLMIIIGLANQKKGGRYANYSKMLYNTVVNVVDIFQHLDVNSGDVCGRIYFKEIKMKKYLKKFYKKFYRKTMYKTYKRLIRKNRKYLKEA